MSEVAVATAAPEAVAAPEVAIAPVQQAEPIRYSAAAYERSIGVRADSAAPESVATDTVAPAPDASAQPLPEGESTPPAAEGSPEGTQDQAQAAEGSPADGVRRVEVPEGHALRAQGIEYLNAESEQHERAIRALINGYAPKRDRDHVAKLERDLAAERRARIEMEANQAAVEKWQQTPRYKQIVERYHEIDETAGQDAALAFWNQHQSELAELKQQEVQARTDEYARQEAEAAGNAWAEGMLEQLGTTLPEGVRAIPHYQQWFVEELGAFDRMVADRSKQPGYIESLQHGQLEAEFADRFRFRLSKEPAVKEWHRRTQASAPPVVDEAARQASEQAAATAAAAQAAENTRKELEAAALNAATNPMGNISPGTVIRTSQQAQPVMNAKNFDRLMSRR